MKQPEALRLAEVFSWSTDLATLRAHRGPASAELRRLHALNAELVEALTECAGRLHVHMIHTEDLIAHMKATGALSKAKES